jgi:hypothetical protein
MDAGVIAVFRRAGFGAEIGRALREMECIFSLAAAIEVEDSPQRTRSFTERSKSNETCCYIRGLREKSPPKRSLNGAPFGIGKYEAG